MSKVLPVKGTRDFYPELMAVHNWLLDGWRSVSHRNGFVEYDGPIFEHLQLYTQKSGEGIVSELFSMTDRGGRELAIRPEMTPTLARMVNQQINALPRPIKWFSMPRCCRAERPQKGRLREFFQWNIDIIGEADVLADAECIVTAVDYLRSVKLGPEDVRVKISSRSMLAAMLAEIGFSPEACHPLYALLDKRPKLPEETFATMVAEAVPDPQQRQGLMQLQAVESLEALAEMAHSAPAKAAIEELQRLFAYLEGFGVAAYCEFDIRIVRGLAYYTGPVFEIFDAGNGLRAVGAGGRYDNLLAGLGGPQVTGTGFGMGDVVLGILLEEKGLLGRNSPGLDCFVVIADEALQDRAVHLVGRLRAEGFATDFSYKTTSVGKQLKQASSRQARTAVILGEETLKDGVVTVKNLADGSQQAVTLDAFSTDPAAFLRGSD